MAEKKNIHSFALKYYNLYANPQTVDTAVEKGFADQCSALGFDLDKGQKFIDTYSEEAFNGCSHLKSIISDVNDADLLGSAILYQWRYVTHWSYHSSLLDDEFRPWFITALNRLAVITANSNENPFVFSGSLKKIQLTSNNISFGPSPKPDDEVEQHLTINSGGRVWLSRYRFGSEEGKRELIEKKNFRLTPESAEKIMKMVSGYFSSEYDIEFITNVGSWNLTLTNTEGSVYKITGPMFLDLLTEEGGLSDIIRHELEQPDLFVFDGNPDAVSRIELNYHRSTKINRGADPSGKGLKYESQDYNERLVIDSGKQTLEHTREIGSECKIMNVYYVKDAISNLLDGLDIDCFTESEIAPSDPDDEMLDAQYYTVKIYTKYGEQREIKSTFDKNGLPSDWAEFINDVHDFMAFYGVGELFDKRMYERPRRRKFEYIFCNVIFEEGGRAYYYLADKNEYFEGDLVIVPVGENDSKSIGRIESVEYYSEESAPVPVDNVKRILRRY